MKVTFTEATMSQGGQAGYGYPEFSCLDERGAPLFQVTCASIDDVGTARTAFENAFKSIRHIAPGMPG